MTLRSSPRPLAGSLLVGTLLAAAVLVGGCAQTVAGTPEAVPLPTIDGARLEDEVRAVLAQDPNTATLARTALVQCPRQVVVYPTLVIFCQVDGGGRIGNVPVTILDRDGNYQIGPPF